MDKHFKLVESILSTLAPEPMRWTPLQKKSILDGDGTSRTFEQAMRWAMDIGYVEKVSRGTYRISPMGILFLQSLPKS